MFSSLLFLFSCIFSHSFRYIIYVADVQEHQINPKQPQKQLFQQALYIGPDFSGYLLDAERYITLHMLRV